MIGVLALYRAWTAPANAYEFAGKRPKNTWLALTGVSAVVQVLGVFSAFTGVGNTMLMLRLMVAVVSGVFWPGVWPVVGGRRFRRVFSEASAPTLWPSQAHTVSPAYRVPERFRARGVGLSTS